MLVPTASWPKGLLRPKKKMLFVHTPKCGGKFVSAAFGRYSRRCISLQHPEMKGHLTLSEYKSVFTANNLEFSDYTFFSVIRNPWQWQLSWYHCIRNDAGGKHSGMPDEHDLLQRFSFLDYLNWLDDPLTTGRANQYYLQQVSDWVVAENGAIEGIDILRQENLGQDLRHLAEKYSLHLRIPKRRRNVSFEGDYRAEYCPQGVDIVTRRHARDLALFHYCFDDSNINLRLV